MTEFNTAKALAALHLPNLFTFADGTPVTRENAAKRRRELYETMCRNVYGFLPPSPKAVDFQVVEEDAERALAGKAVYKIVRLSFPVGSGRFSFDVKMMLPKKNPCPPFVVIPNFRNLLPDEYIPAEELIDRGIGFGTYCYKTDVTADDGDFTSGIAGLLYPDGRPEEAKEGCGKIAMWAYCASRVLDYVLSHEQVDRTHLAVAGHSRLGKTALLAAASDERFTCVFSNDSGCAGAALTRGKRGERVRDITGTFPYWFCGNYAAYAAREEEMPFDQHFLLAAVAPRRVFVASAAEDTWADPISEYLCCHAASDFWRLFGTGEGGFSGEGLLPAAGERVFGKAIGYHVRPGVHYLSRDDWNCFLDFFLTD